MRHSIITKDHLEAVGITPTSEQETEALLAHLNTTLEERIGAEITTGLDDVKLAELVAVQSEVDDAKLADWMRANVPELQEIVEDEIDILLGEIADNADSLTTEN